MLLPQQQSSAAAAGAAHLQDHHHHHNTLALSWSQCGGGGGGADGCGRKGAIARLRASQWSTFLGLSHREGILINYHKKRACL